MKICPVVADLFRADRRTEGQTDMTELKDAFRNFVDAFKNSRTYCVVYFNFRVKNDKWIKLFVDIFPNIPKRKLLI